MKTSLEIKEHLTKIETRRLELKNKITSLIKLEPSETILNQMTAIDAEHKLIDKKLIAISHILSLKAKYLTEEKEFLNEVELLKTEKREEIKEIETFLKEFLEIKEPTDVQIEEQILHFNLLPTLKGAYNQILWIMSTTTPINS